MGSFLKKKVFNKKNLKKAGGLAKDLAMKELNRRMQSGELSEEDLGFGKWLKKKVFNKKNLNRRMQSGELDEEDLYDTFAQLKDEEEESLICKMDENKKCVGLKGFMTKVENTVKNMAKRKQVL